MNALWARQGDVLIKGSEHGFMVNGEGGDSETDSIVPCCTVILDQDCIVKAVSSNGMMGRGSSCALCEGVENG
jgi:hypothetical protein